MVWYKHVKGSGVILGVESGWVEASMSPHKTSSILRRIRGFLWPKPHACPLQPGGRRKRNTVRSKEREGQTVWVMDYLLCHSALQQNGKNAVVMSLYLFTTQTRTRLTAGERMDWIKFGSNVLLREANWYQNHETVLQAAANFSLRHIGTLLKWYVQYKKALLITWPSGARRYCVVVGVEGRDSHFLSGPNTVQHQSLCTPQLFPLPLLWSRLTERGR